MNSLQIIDIDYLRPNRTIEATLVSNPELAKVFYVYNYEGYSFRVFNSIPNLILFFQGEMDCDIHFESEIELDKFLSEIDLTILWTF